MSSSGFGSKGKNSRGTGTGSSRGGNSSRNNNSDYGDEGDGPWAIDWNEVEIGGLIATGSFGIVHSGKFQGKKVAVKFLLFPESSTEDDMGKVKRGFRQEVAVWHKLSHPNIVQFMGAYINPPKWAIVTEFLDGGTLKGYLGRLNRRRMPLKQMITMALDIANGMAYLHKNNIIHRDLKSANLLLDKDGMVKVADFGLARSESVEPGNMTAETGTIRWMAPEMINHQPYSRKVDVYSFGIVLWELCTSDFPFEGFSFVQLAYAIVTDSLRPPTDNCAKELMPLMLACWDKDPDVRPDFDVIVETLERQALQVGKTTRGEQVYQEPVKPTMDATKMELAHAGGGGGSGNGSGTKLMEQPKDSGWKKLNAPVHVEPAESVSAGPQGGCCSLM